MATSDGSPTVSKVPKVINDPIHGTIELHKFAELIMATPEFQRLRHIKQLGLTYLVYPSATHTRFEHSVGTYHLAWQLAKMLKARAPTPSDTKLTEDEVVCVALAGLCHDLGHGPFSHFWERLVKTKVKGYEHENMSVKMIDRIVKKVIESGCEGAKEFKEFMEKKYSTNDHQPSEEVPITNLELIKNLVLGGPKDEEIPPKRQFLYEIVNNKRTGFDVDKWDYINRDSYFLGLNNKFDCQRQLAMLRVMSCKDQQKTRRNLLVVRDKQVLEYIQLLVARRVNHYISYRHIKVIGFEKLLSDALQFGLSYLEKHQGSQAYRYLVEAPNSEETLCWLTDARLELLLKEHCGEDAKKLMQRLDSRKMYNHVATAHLALKDPEAQQDYKKFQNAIEKIEKDWNSQNPLTADSADYSTIVEVCKMDYSSGLSHPLSKVYFYTKQGSEGQRCNENSLFSDLLLSSLHVTIVLLYERTPAEPYDVVEAQQKKAEAVNKFKEQMTTMSEQVNRQISEQIKFVLTSE